MKLEEYKDYLEELEAFIESLKGSNGESCSDTLELLTNLERQYDVHVDHFKSLSGIGES